jgi:hypothetical protein
MVDFGVVRYLCVPGPGEGVSRGEAPVHHPFDSGNLNPQKWHLSASYCTLSAHSGHFLVLNTLKGFSLRTRSLRMPSTARVKQYGITTSATAIAAPAASCGALDVDVTISMSAPTTAPTITNHQSTFIGLLQRFACFAFRSF